MAAETAGLVALGSLLSLIATGWVPFVDNNLFHLPILGRLYDLPQFAGDPFIQSLRFYSSGLWQALAGSDRLVDPWWTLLALAVSSRALAVYGFLSCVALLGVTGFSQRALFVALLAACDLLLGYSYAGGGGIFMNHATHSEAANGLLLLSWSFAARARFGAALALTGAAFFCNAFMGVWNLPALAAVALYHLRAGGIDLRTLARQGLSGGAVFALFAAPVLAVMLSSPDFGARPPVDYRDFLAEYWPKHFLFDEATPAERLGLIFVAALAAFAFPALGRRGAPFAVLFLGFAGLYGAGIAAPSLTGSPAILNLHLLRSGVALHLLAALAALALATLWLTAPARRERLFGASLVVTLCVLPASTVLAVAVLAFERLTRRLGGGRVPLRGALVPALWTGLGVAVAASVALGAATQQEKNRRFRAFTAEWAAVAEWSRTNTPADAVFLTPIVRLGQAVPDAERARATAVSTSAGFERWSERRVFVDFKRGAAVMWAPSYYATWRSRAADVLALGSLQERRDYAASHGITHVIDICSEDGGDAPLFRTKRLCVFPSGKG